MERFARRARTLRAGQTSAEARLWRALRNRTLDHWKFRRQHPIDRYVVDFVSIKGRLIIEVDGGTHFTAAELSHDANRTEVLETLGFHVIRVTNEEVRTNLPGVLDFILSEITRDPSSR
jgi:very-short-patch-repair endonuclease